VVGLIVVAAAAVVVVMVVVCFAVKAALAVPELLQTKQSDSGLQRDFVAVEVSE
jgi:hypothetical protein